MNSVVMKLNVYYPIKNKAKAIKFSFQFFTLATFSHINCLDHMLRVKLFLRKTQMKESNDTKKQHGLFVFIKFNW
jgi:hypothetical protein